MNVVLCGMMGSGKTTVAQSIKKLYNKNVVDTDAEIVKEHGAISAIFESVGEKAFRQIESQIALRISNLDDVIISTGGGLVLNQNSVDALKTNGKIFYLQASEQTLIKRLKGDDTRPLLVGDIEQKIKDILSGRESVYQSVADYVINTDDKTPDQIAREIMEKAL